MLFYYQLIGVISIRLRKCTFANLNRTLSAQVSLRPRAEWLAVVVITLIGVMRSSKDFCS